MINRFRILGMALLLTGCDQPVTKSKDIPAKGKEEAEIQDSLPDLKSRSEELMKQGYQTFIYDEGDTTYLMQQYYMVFLKAGKIRSQDSAEAAQLQKKHLEHLGRMAREGYASLIGPFGDDGEIRGIVVYNTPTQKEADSLAKLDPMVKSGRLEVEVHPWWAAKGGKLN